MADSYKDFIPANEDPGALGSGFTDFVPPREPKLVETPQTEAPLVPEVDEASVEEASKKEKK